MKLRRLSEKDIPFQLEWMHNEEVNSNFQFDFSRRTYEEVFEFIKNGSNDKNVHMAIVDDIDEYLGTISLKNIDYDQKIAEYAIVVRKAFWGKGVASFATHEILNIANELGLVKVFLTVLESNTNAQELYKKYGFIRDSHKDKMINIKGKDVINLYYEKLLGELDEH